jgi:hypothetical protein
VSRQSQGRGGPSGLADVLDVLLDKGLVIDAFVRVSLVGIELLTIDARIVIAGVDTYLHFAEAVNRLDLLQVNSSQTLPEMVGGGGKRRQQNDNSQGQQEQRGQEQQAGSQQGGSQQRRELENDDSSNSDNDRGDGKGLLSRIADRGHAF